MAKRQINTNATGNISAQPLLHQRAREIQAYGTVNHALSAWNQVGWCRAPRVFA